MQNGLISSLQTLFERNNDVASHRAKFKEVRWTFLNTEGGARIGRCCGGGRYGGIWITFRRRRIVHLGIMSGIYIVG